MQSAQLTFLNHASFMVETDTTVLVIDPWLEGFAFDEGWALIDQSTTNAEIVAHLSSLGKEVVLWYSHEHSDHFSIPFLKTLQAREIKVKIFFQKTLDGRVAAFIRKLGFEVIETAGQLEAIHDGLGIAVWPHHSGDSYCLIKLGDITILNLNDCVVHNVKTAQKIRYAISKVTNHVDILLTQFGYASWVGNVDATEFRKKNAEEKLDRIKFQNDVLNPDCIIPFASFIKFCHEENFYLNSNQNLPSTLLTNEKLSAFKNKIIFLKPGDEIKLDGKVDLADLATISSVAATHWNRKFDEATVETKQKKSLEFEDINSLFQGYKKKLKKPFLILPQLLQMIGFIKPLRVFVHDQNICYELSYLASDIKSVEILDWDVKMSSETLGFALKHEFGYNTTHVNAKFQEGYTGAFYKFARFFSPQEYMKTGWGISHPILSIRMFISAIASKVSN